MLFYCLFISIIIFFSANYTIGRSPKPKIFTIFGILFFVAILIFRFDVGWDYFAYYQIFNPKFDVGSVERFEPIGKGICYLVDYFNYPPLFFFIFGVATCFFVFNTLLKFTNNFLLSILAYTAIFFDTCFGIVREGLAIAIILYAYRYLINEKWIKYIVMCIIAGLTHYSAFICLFFPFLYKFLKNPWRLLLAMTILSVSIWTILHSILMQFDLYDEYLDGTVDELGGGSMLRYINALILMSIYILSYIRSNNNDTDKRLISLGILGMIFPFILGGHLGGRISFYFMIYICIAAPNILTQYKRQIRILYTLGFASLFLMTLYVSTKNKEKSPYTPYQTIFSMNPESPVFR